MWPTLCDRKPGGRERGGKKKQEAERDTGEEEEEVDIICSTVVYCSTVLQRFLELLSGCRFLLGL